VNHAWRLHGNRILIEFGIVVAAVLVVQTITSITQERITVDDGRGYDGGFYYRVAEQLAGGERPTGPSRFARRIGTPFVAGLVDSEDLIRGFTVVNAVAGFVSALLLLIWLRMHLGSSWLRIALVVLYATHWLQPVRFTFFYPVLVDAWAQAFCFAGLIFIAMYETRPRRWLVVALSLISVAGVFFREIVLLVPLAFLFASGPEVEHRLEFPYVRFRNLPRLAQWIPMVAACAALVWLDGFVAATDPEFSAAAHFEVRAFSRSLISYSLGWMVAFGPALFVVLFDWRSAVAYLSRHKAYLVYMVGVAALGWAASLESERHAINWGAPIVFVLLGRAIERGGTWLRTPGLVAILVAAQILVNRLFLTTPQPRADYRSDVPALLLTPLGERASYLHLFPDYVLPRMAWMQFAQFVLLGLLVLTWMSRRAYARRATEQP
jgi:hypothetical protein